MGLSPLVEDSSVAAVMIMLIVQLDGQLLMIFINWIQLEIAMAAIDRCMQLVNFLQGNKIKSISIITNE